MKQKDSYEFKFHKLKFIPKSILSASLLKTKQKPFTLPVL